MTRPNPLILVLTRRCNLRCGFCPQGFASEDMPAATMRLALKGLLPRLAAPRRIKFFGGEPLLRAALVREAVVLALGLDRACSFQLPTNGTLIDEELIRFLCLYPEVETVLGRLSPWAGRLPNVSHNFMLMPGERAEATLGRFAAAVAAGLRRFNFLPAYFVPWEESQLLGLRRVLAGLARLMRGLDRRGRRILVKNPEQTGSVPLYNDGLTVDTDGRVYSSNLILARGARRRARSLCLGHVRGPQKLAWPQSDGRVERALNACFGAETVARAWRIDAILDEFVKAIT